MAIEDIRGRGDKSMTERIPVMFERLERLERDMHALEQFLRSSVDDIKNTVKGEVADLKTETIADLKEKLKEQAKQLADMELRLRVAETDQIKWKTSAGVVNWMIRTAFGLIGAGATILGYETFGKH